MKNVNPKKLLALLLAVAMLTSVFCIMPVSAATDEVSTITCGDYTYTLAEDGTAVIAGYTGTETDVTIPTELDGIKVSKIGASSFRENRTLTSLIIPGSISTVGRNSFLACSSIKSINILDGVTTLEPSAFAYCESLETISIPESAVNIIGDVFCGCAMLSDVKLPSKITTIGGGLFSDCSSIKSIEIPSTVTEIGQGAFEYCTGLESIVIPENVKIIKNAVFSNCTNLKSVTLNEGLEQIYAYCFNSCSSLMELTVPDSVTDIRLKAVGYNWDNEKWDYVLRTDFTLKGYRGSAADNYAQSYGLKFESIGDSIITPPTDPLPPVNGVNTVFLKNTKNYAAPYAHYWIKDGQGTDWPGVEMTKVSDDVYKVEVPAEYNMILFSDKGTNKMQDIAIVGNYMMYVDGKWQRYSDTPVATESQETTAPSETTSEDTTPTVTESKETTPTVTESKETTPTVTESKETTPTVTESQETTAPSETTSQDTTPTATESQETTASTETDPAPVFDYYVVGSPELFGVSWAEDSANGMTKGDDGIYHLTIKNAPAGTFGFKVKDSNGGWHPDGMGNDGSVTTTGGETVIFSYDPNVGFAIVSVDGEIPTYPLTSPTDETKPTETEPKPTETEPTECDHAKTTTTGKKAATYFAKGYTGDKVCDACGEVVAKGKATDKKVLKTPKVTVKATKKAIKVTYKNNVKDAKGFKVTYKLGKKTYTKKFTLTKKELKKAKVTKTIKVKKSGKYKVTVKAFVTSGKKVAYSGATKAVTAKVK